MVYSTFITFALFIIIAFITFYFPGKLVLEIFRFDFNKIEKFIISWVLGISLFILTAYFFAWLNLSHLYPPVLIAINLFYFWKNAKKFRIYKPNLNDLDFWSILLILVGSASFLSIMFFSGWKTSEGIQFIGINATDGITHLAYIQSLSLSFPPKHPELAGIPLRGYHYFYDFLLNRFNFFYHFSVEDLYFRLFPLLISLLYGASFFLLISRMTVDRIKKGLVLFFAYFSPGFTIFLEKNKNFGNAFVSQPIELILNPSVILSISILLIVLFLLPQMTKSWKYSLLVGLLLGGLSQTKIYAGLIGITLLLIYTVYLNIKYKGRYISNCFLNVFITGILTIITFLPNNWGSGGLIFAPLLYYRYYMQQPLFDSLYWEIKNQIYSEHNNYLRIIQLYLEAIIIFWIFNLGTKIIILFRLNTILKASFWKNDLNFLVFCAIFIPIFIASLFIQSISVFDVAQFLWIALALVGIPAGIIWGELVTKRKTVLKALILVILFFMSLHNYLNFEKNYLFNSRPLVVTNAQISFAKSVKELIPKDEFLTVLPVFQEMNLQQSSRPLMSYLTGRYVYYEGVTTQFKLGEVYNARKETLLQLNFAVNECNQDKVVTIMGEIGSKYLITSFAYPCLATSSAVVKSIETKGIAFYRFN